jgi:thiol-disulfide isomerase/thioredoxin
MRILLFLLLGYCCIAFRTGAVSGASSVNDSTEIYVKFRDSTRTCHVFTPLASSYFSLDFISREGELKNVVIMNRDTVIKLPPAYKILSVPAEGFLYGRKCYFKLSDGAKIEIKVNNKVPEVTSEKISNNAVYEFWNSFNKTCPYYSVNKALASDVEKEENRARIYRLRKQLYHQALTLLDSIIKEENNADKTWLKELLKYEWLSDCLLASQQLRNYYQNDPEFTSEMGFYKFKNVDLINYPVFQGFLHNYLERILLNDQRIPVGTHAFTYRYYDALKKIDSLPTSLSKTYLLKYSLEMTNEHFDSRTTLAAIEKVKKMQDPSLSKEIEALTQQIKLRETLNTRPEEFVTADLKLHSLQNIIDANKGKVLYVDIWASWCLPCRAAMPYSKIVRENFKDQKIAFVYFSVDEDFDKWKKAAEQEGLIFYPNSFKATNPGKNTFLSGLNTESIPRYVIFDKNGKLVHPNAPGPGSKELDVLLKHYLEN